MKTGPKLVLLLVVLVTAGSGAWVYFRGLPSWAGGEVQAQEEQRKKPPSPVVLAEAKTGTVVIAIDAVGDVVAREAVTLSSRVSGRVEEVLFSDNQTVKQGDILVRLDPADAEAAVSAAQAEADELEQAQSRADQLAQSGAGPQATADDRRRQVEAARSQVQSAQERLDDYNISAPFDGRLGLRDISVGTLMQPGAEIVTIDTIDPIDLRFTVPDIYLGQVKLDARVRATSPGFEGATFEGQVKAVDSRVDPALRTVTVEALLPNPDGRLLPGMLMNVSLDLGTRENVVLVPPLAVQLQGSSQYVFTVKDNKAERIDVETGERSADSVEIRKGLEQGTKVVVQGPQGLSAGQEVKEAEAEQPPEGRAPNAKPAPATSTGQ